MGRNLGVEYKMRLSQELKDKIAKSAKELNRSINADIVDRLEKSFGTEKEVIGQTKFDVLLGIFSEKLAENGYEIKISKINDKD